MAKNLQDWLAPFGLYLTDNDPAIWANDIRMDSRAVVAGDVFVAIKGHCLNGLDYITDACQRGAVAIVVDQQDQIAAEHFVALAGNGSANHRCQVIAVSELGQTLPALLLGFYPQVNQCDLIGITGTNGKTSISQMIGQLSAAKASQTAVIGTLGIGIVGAGGSELLKQDNTTPGIIDNYRLLDQFARGGCDHVVVEVTSHALVQQRVSGIAFDVVMFTNLSQDHLDYHVNMRDYGAAKKRLFDENPTALKIINIDDPLGATWYQQYQANSDIIVIGRYHEAYIGQSFLCYSDVVFKATGIAFNLHSSWGDSHIECPLFGLFNVSNLLSALASLLALGYSLPDLIAQVAQLRPIDGRMEQFVGRAVNGAGGDHKDPNSQASNSQAIVAVVDFAHTPDALGLSLQALRSHVGGRLWCIFGCGGDRDKSKRPMMAQMAEQYADRMIITNDNPRNESGAAIALDIQQGFSAVAMCEVILDRQQAIRHAIAQARSGDVILIAGKGHETTQIFADKVTNYNERAFVQQIMKETLA